MLQWIFCISSKCYGSQLHSATVLLCTKHEVNIIDAINDTNWVRSKIAAHNILENYKSARNLSVYDVNNAQNLAQRLILGSMGFCK